MSSEELALIPSIILSISTLALVIITIYYAKQTRHLVEETRRESRRGVMLQLTNEIYKPLYDTIKEVERIISEFSPILGTDNVTDIMRSFWYYYVNDDAKIALDRWLDIINGYATEMKAVREQMWRVASVILDRRFNDVLDALKKRADAKHVKKPTDLEDEFSGIETLKEDAKDLFRNDSIERLWSGEELKKMIEGSADDRCIVSFSNYIKRKGNDKTKELVANGLVQELSNNLQEEGVFERLSQLRNDVINKTKELLELLNAQSKDIVS